MPQSLLLPMLLLGACLLLTLLFRHCARTCRDRSREPDHATSAAAQTPPLLYALLDHTDNAILALDRELRVTYANRRYCELWSIEPDFLADHPTLRAVLLEICRLGLYPESEIEYLIERRQRSLEATLDIIQLETPRRDGVIVEGFATRLPDGGFLLSFRDVTEQVRNSEQLRKKREHYRTLIETIPHGIIECDEQGRITFVNQSYCTMRQARPEALIGTYLPDLVADSAARKQLIDSMQQLRDGQTAPAPLILPNLDHAGQPVWRRLDWKDLRDSAGRLTGFLGVITDVTAETILEAQLRDSAAGLRQLFEAAPMAIVNLDAAGKILHWNQRAAEILGWNDGLAIGQAFAQLSLPAGQRDLFADLLKAGCTGQNARAELLVLNRAGELFEISMVVGPLGGAGDRADEVVAIIDDIRERKRLELTLRNREETYRNLVEAAPVAIFVHVDGYLVFLNPAAVALFGATSAEELVGEAIESLLHPEDRSRFSEALNLADVDPVAHNRFPLRIAPRSGQEREVDATFLGVDYSGCSARMAICVDVTERNRAEEALRHSEASHRRLSHEFLIIFNGIPDSLTVWSTDRRLIWANRSSSDYFNLELTELTGVHCEQICPYDSCLAETCEIRQCLATEQQDERMRKTRDGRTWGIKTFPLRDTDGTLIQVIRLASDLSERVRLREEATRTAHLAALGELAAGVAHEVNNPTGLILLDLPVLRDAFRDARPILEAQLRRDGDFPFAGLKYSQMRDQIPAMLDEVVDGAQRIKQIVEELKDFSHPTDPHQFDLLDLNEVVRKAAGLAGGQIRKLTDHFTVDYLPTLPLIRGSFHRLVQVVINLLLNAGQALPERSHAIAVTLAARPDARRIAIIIRDEGVGIQAEHLQQITDPFFTTRREIGGTGLGLSVSSRIVQEHGGTLHFASTPGTGTTVTLEFPFAEELSHE